LPPKLLKIGVMGGTFNPIHHGHLITAEEAFVQFGLDKVIFMPTGWPPHKEDKEIISAEDRYLMTVIATAPNPHFTVSRLEVDRPGPSYSIDTIKALREIYGQPSEIFFITGADAVWEILTWKQPEILTELCNFIAATRPGYDLEKFKKMHPDGEKIKTPKVFFMEVPALAISSTDIRRRVSEGRPIRYLVPEGVANYIYKYEFYAEKTD